MKLREQLEIEAAKYGIKVNDVEKGVELEAPEGMQFDAELHWLVNTQWDRDPMPNVLRSAMRDVREYGPRLRKCPDDCPCKETVDGTSLQTTGIESSVANSSPRL